MGKRNRKLKKGKRTEENGNTPEKWRCKWKRETEVEKNKEGMKERREIKKKNMGKIMEE